MRLQLNLDVKRGGKCNLREGHKLKEQGSDESKPKQN